MVFHTAASAPSEERYINDPSSDGSHGNFRCLDTSSNFLCTNFCIIRGLGFNFKHADNQLFSSKPHLLFLTEMEVCVATDNSCSSVPSYFLYSHFHTKAGCCVYVRNDILCSCAHNIESSEFSTTFYDFNVNLLLSLFALYEYISHLTPPAM